MGNESRNNVLFQINTKAQFLVAALETFRFQYAHNKVYQEFCKHLKVTPQHVRTIVEIPFLPIHFFKGKQIVSNTDSITATFTSSGTTGSITSKHFVTDISLYEESYRSTFERFYGTPSSFCIVALLPSYLEREGSSLIYMVNDLIKKSGHPKSGFFLHDIERLKNHLIALEATGTKTLLIGVSFALLDFCEQYQFTLKNTTVMETGGMKGRRKELIREELHALLKTGFGVDHIHSEYGMTELLSQAYSKGNGVFDSPPWMKVLVRDTEDPFSYQANGKPGGINVIDLANRNSCSFIATQDLGKKYDDDSFEIIGRFDHSDIRGCNLMAL
ncbi:MAG: phenylacetate-coenzyme A ligase PaaK-like adenylate-forming protein [Maribacter sp.]|jgi:phenylacetate-coenzyme A ligase PaaK-like adenylate-forming protein